jgi:Protein of unknown function (DUF2917)
MPHATDSFALPAGHTAAFHQRHNCVLHVTQGRLWITCSHDLTDHFVVAGGHLRIGPGHVVLEADTGPALYRLTPDTYRKVVGTPRHPAITTAV